MSQNTMAQGRPPSQEPSFQGTDLSTGSSDAAYGTYFLGRYRVVDEIGVGGMASVHLARMDGAGGFQKWVAIKRIHPHLIEDEQFIHMFLDEARIAARISHPNVAQVFDLGVHENTYWIAMEYLHGEPLREVMRFNEEKALATNPDLAARIIADAAEGLHAAHELRGKDGEPLNLVHRDVSPHNLFLTYEGMVKVVDFGIAKVSGRLSSTRAGTLKGKLAYMSPEQVRGSAIDRRTDIFALGVVLWEMTTGQRLFRMDSDLETLEKVQSCIVPPPSNVRPDFPVELESVIMQALHKRREQRFQTARELSRALQQYLMRSGQFVGPEEVSAYVTGIFGDRIRKREAHLRWAAEVTQTISLQEVAADSPRFDEISLLSYEDSSELASTLSKPAANAAGILAARPTLPSTEDDDGGVTRAARPPRRDVPAPRLPPAHGIHLPAPRLPPDKVNFPVSSVVISGTPPSTPAPDIDDEDDEDVATIVVPSRSALDQGGIIPAAGMPPPAPIPAAGSKAPSFFRSQPTMPPSHAMAQGFPNPYYAPAPVSAPSAAVYPGFLPPGVSAPPPSYAFAPGAFPIRPDETAQLPSVQNKNLLVYVAAALGTFFAVVGIAAVFLIRSHSSEDSTQSSSSTVSSASTRDTPASTLPTANHATPSAEATTTTTTTAITTTVAATALPTPTVTRTTAVIPTRTVPTSTRKEPTPASPPATTTTPVAKGEPGFLTVVCNPFCDSVSVGGRNLGPSPVVNVPLPPGQYSVVLRRSGGSSKVVPATIVSGKTTSHRVSMN
ncbi:MAG TPA: protein kinase [Polyangiaceae bacterium]|nr:protein kinase [Polyangiaceae bacterium]HQM11600.1 protein kinase [Polyangiaceae bacterium]